MRSLTLTAPSSLGGGAPGSEESSRARRVPTTWAPSREVLGSTMVNSSPP